MKERNMLKDHITCVTRQHCQNKAEESNQCQPPAPHDESCRDKNTNINFLIIF